MRDERQERREIAVANERLARPPHLVDVEQRQDLRAAEAAADRDERRDRLVAPRRTQGLGAHRRRPREIALAGKHRIVVNRFEAEPPKLLDRRDRIRRDGTCWLERRPRCDRLSRARAV